MSKAFTISRSVVCLPTPRQFGGEDVAMPRCDGGRMPFPSIVMVVVTIGCAMYVPALVRS